MRLVRGAALSLLLAIALFSLSALAQESDAPQEADPTKICLDAFSAAQANRRAGKLISARGDLIACSQATCPEEIVAKCTPWLRDVKEAVPSIIVIARDIDGNDLTDVQITIDGTSLDEALYGRPLEIDPGTHSVVVEPRGHAKIELQVVVVHSEKNRYVIARLKPPPPPPAPPSPPAPPAPVTLDPESPDPAVPDSRGISPWAWVGFSVGAAALVAAAVTGVLAIDKANELEDTCQGTLCSVRHQEAFDEGARLANASTGLFVGGGVGVAFGVVALIWLGGDF